MSAEREEPRGVTRPAAGTKTGRVWEIADSLMVDGNLPARRRVVETAVAEGINEATASTQYARWLRGQRGDDIGQATRQTRQQGSTKRQIERSPLRINFWVSRPSPVVRSGYEEGGGQVIVPDVLPREELLDFHKRIRKAIHERYSEEEGWSIDKYLPDYSVEKGERSSGMTEEARTTASPEGLTEAQRKLIELDRRKAEVKKFYDDYADAVAAVVKESGVGCHFQDEEGVVYQTAEPSGRFIYYEKYVVNRTRRLDEKAGTLSLTKARELGYTTTDKEK